MRTGWPRQLRGQLEELIPLQGRDGTKLNSVLGSEGGQTGGADTSDRQEASGQPKWTEEGEREGLRATWLSAWVRKGG